MSSLHDVFDVAPAAVRTSGSPVSPGQASPSRCSTPASTSSIPTSAARSCGGSTCSTPAATRAPARTRPLPGGPSGTAPRWPASSRGRAARRVCEGVAPGATLLPIRVAGWQPDASGGVSVYGRTDQLLAGIELAVDPNEDGDAHDAARITLVGVVEPFAAFTDGPLAAAAAGASVLDSLIVAAAGNDGPAGPAYGSVGGPGGAPAALTAGAIDTRRRSPTAHVLLLAGLRSLVSGVQPLGGVGRSRALAVCAGRRARPRRPGRRRCGRWPDASLRQLRVQPRRRRGSAAAARGRPRPRPCARSSRPVPVRCSSTGPCRRGRWERTARQTCRSSGSSGVEADAVRSRAPVRDPGELAVGATAFDANDGLGGHGTVLVRRARVRRGPKPELSAAGIGLATSDPGRNEDGAARYGTLSGSSAAAALTAGAAALLAQARPDLDAAGLKQALVASARRRGGGASGLVDPSAAAARSLSPSRRRWASALARPRTRPSRGSVTLRNVSRRALDAHDRAGHRRCRRHRRSRPVRSGEAEAGDVSARLGLGDRSTAAPRARPRLAARSESGSGAAPRCRCRGRSRCRSPKPDLIPSARLSSRVLRAVGRRACRADGRRRAASTERPSGRSCCPLTELAIDLFRGDRRARPPRARAGRAPGALRVRHHRSRAGREAPAAGQRMRSASPRPRSAAVGQTGRRPVRDLARMTVREGKGAGRRRGFRCGPWPVTDATVRADSAL